MSEDLKAELERLRAENASLKKVGAKGISLKVSPKGGLSIYGGGPIRQYEPWAKEFEQRFPGIQVKITGGYSGGRAPRIDKPVFEYNIANDYADIVTNPGLLADAEVIFSGWGAPMMDEAFLEAAPNLRAVFYGAGTIGYCTSEAFWVIVGLMVATIIALVGFFRFKRWL